MLTALKRAFGVDRRHSRDIGPHPHQSQISIEFDGLGGVNVIAKKTVHFTSAYFVQGIFDIRIHDAFFHVETGGEQPHHVIEISSAYGGVSDFQIEHRHKHFALQMSAGPVAGQQLRMRISPADQLGRER